MSEWKPRVVELTEQNTRKHENADKLSIADIDGFPVVFQTSEFTVPGLAAYFPEDTILNDGTVIRSKKLRGVLSIGMLTPLPEGRFPQFLNDDGKWKVGDDVTEFFNLTKVKEPDADLALETENESCPFRFPEYTDIESYQKYGFQTVTEWEDSENPENLSTEYNRVLVENRKSIFDGMDVTVTEKIHGANARYVYKDGRLWVGSRTNVKRYDPRSIWWRAAKHHELEKKLAQIPDVVVYGEVYGQVQNLKYGIEGEVRFRAFDAFSLKAGEFYDSEPFQALMENLDIPTVPILYQGPWTAEIEDMRNGKSILADHHREGFVIKPMFERFSDRFGRVILKAIGEEYREAKGKAARKGDERVVALRKQLEAYKALKAAAEVFVARVERGEVRSRKTYGAFKDALEEIQKAETP